MSQLQIFFIMPINRRQNLNEKQKLLTRPLLPYYSRAGTVQGLLLGRVTQNVFGYRDIQGTDLIRVRRLHPGFVCSIEGGNGPILVHDCRGWESIPPPNNHSRTIPQGSNHTRHLNPRPNKVKLTLYLYSINTGHNKKKRNLCWWDSNHCLSHSLSHSRSTC